MLAARDGDPSGLVAKATRPPGCLTEYLPAGRTDLIIFIGFHLSKGFLGAGIKIVGGRQSAAPYGRPLWAVGRKTADGKLQTADDGRGTFFR
ncbi:MAG: hypothetical protein AMS15_02965 [Planctomycetes bacterium DG_23]|nr:MAG: hypothetical protein AMS15_02965 [Planctomycetes bacterium DG_23]